MKRPRSKREEGNVNRRKRGECKGCRCGVGDKRLKINNTGETTIRGEWGRGGKKGERGEGGKGKPR